MTRALAVAGLLAAVAAVVLLARTFPEDGCADAQDGAREVASPEGLATPNESSLGGADARNQLQPDLSQETPTGVDGPGEPPVHPKTAMLPDRAVALARRAMSVGDVTQARDLLESLLEGHESANKTTVEARTLLLALRDYEESGREPSATLERVLQFVADAAVNTRSPADADKAALQAKRALFHEQRVVFGGSCCPGGDVTQTYWWAYAVLREESRPREALPGLLAQTLKEDVLDAKSLTEADQEVCRQLISFLEFDAQLMTNPRLGRARALSSARALRSDLTGLKDDRLAQLAEFLSQSWRSLEERPRRQR